MPLQGSRSCGPRVSRPPRRRRRSCRSKVRRLPAWRDRVALPADADRTAHAGSAQAAVAAGVLRQVLLVIVLGVIELRRGHDLGSDPAIASRFELALERVARRFGGLTLLI